MSPLTIKLPAIGRLLSKREIKLKEQSRKSTEWVNAWRHRQKDNPKRLQEFKRKKKEQNKRHKEKLRNNKFRQDDKPIDSKMKKAQKIRKRRSRA